MALDKLGENTVALPCDFSCSESQFFVFVTLISFLDSEAR
jgi:hypothetical protein